MGWVATKFAVLDNPATQIFDHHFVEFTYPDGKKMYSQCRHVRNCFERVDEHAFGTKGDGSMQADGGVKDVNGLEFKFDNPYDQEHFTLVDAIRRGLPYNEGHFGATSSMTCRAGTHGHLQRQDRQVGRGCGEGQARGSRALKITLGTPRRRSCRMTRGSTRRCPRRLRPLRFVKRDGPFEL